MDTTTGEAKERLPLEYTQGLPRDVELAFNAREFWRRMAEDLMEDDYDGPRKITLQILALSSPIDTRNEDWDLAWKRRYRTAYNRIWMAMCKWKKLKVQIMRCKKPNQHLLVVRRKP